MVAGWDGTVYRVVVQWEEEEEGSEGHLSSDEASKVSFLSCMVGTSLAGIRSEFGSDAVKLAYCWIWKLFVTLSKCNLQADIKWI